MESNVIDLFEEPEYLIACPDCGGTAMEIIIDDFDLSKAGILFVRCLNLNCGKCVGLKK